MSEPRKYVIGLGKTFVGVVKHENTGLYAIKIEKPIEGIYEVGENVLGKEIPSEDHTYIIVGNLEGLAVLEKSVKFIREKLEESVKQP